MIIGNLQGVRTKLNLQLVCKRMRNVVQQQRLA
jgi:hypothetical protein